jgi:hypothetical protein
MKKNLSLDPQLLFPGLLLVGLKAQGTFDQVQEELRFNLL